MIDALKTLFENDVVSKEIRAQIEEAWEAKIKENRLAATAELREEFAKKYEHDKSVMIESIDAMISERLAEEIREFQEDRRQLSEAKARFAIAMRENSNLLRNFVQEQLKKEIQELRADKRAMESKYSKLEEFVVEALASEISEFHEDKKDLTETKVRLIREAKSNLNKIKQDFIERSARLVAETVDKGLNSEIRQLKEDIDLARKYDFGRKIFEAFSNEFMNSHLNEKSETKKLLKVLDIKDRQLAEVKTIAIKAKKLAESKSTEIKRLNESVKREQIMNELIAPLAKSHREIMKDLLESVQTDRLRSSFDKYLPSVIDGDTPAKKKAVLAEAKSITGNRHQTQTTNSSIAGGDVIDIKRLAGLK